MHTNHLEHTMNSNISNHNFPLYDAAVAVLAIGMLLGTALKFFA